MARKKSQNISLNDIMKLGPKKIILLLIILAASYFFNIEFSDLNTPQNNNNSNYDIVAGVISRVVDGDTAVILINGNETRVRFLGVDTPETVHPNKPVQFYGKEASNFTKNSLTGKHVWLEYDVSPTDRYERHLAYIWLSKPESINENSIRKNMFNAKLLLDGYAKTMIIKPNTRYAKLFTKFQDEAKKSKKGLWRNNY